MSGFGNNWGHPPPPNQPTPLSGFGGGFAPSTSTSTAGSFATSFSSSAQPPVFGTSSTTMTTPFGSSSSTTAPTPSQQQQPPFANTSVMNTTPFAMSASTSSVVNAFPFGSSTSTSSNTAAVTTPAASNNPFMMMTNTATTVQPGAGVSFGMSSSVVELGGPKHNISNGFAIATQQLQPSSANPFSTSSVVQTSSALSNNNPFGIPQQQSTAHFSYIKNSNNVIPFGISSSVANSTEDDSGMDDVDDDVQRYNTSQTSSVPLFRQPFTASAPPPVGTTIHNNNEWARSTTMTMSTMEASTSSSSSYISRPTSTPTPSNDDDNNEVKLAQLKAKLAKKKKILEEKMQREKQTKQQQHMLLNPQAIPFVPSGEILSASQQQQQQQQRLNRFSAESSAHDTTSQLPADLQQSTQQMAGDEYESTNSLKNHGGRNGRETLQNAKALVGTCPYMCPDEEILRRERESDIQLLERLDLGRLHPSHWTLRDTMVKRFRRSAADFKLDVPEWVRPPDVLERVCAYLEEWVMEGDRQGPDPRFKDATPPSLDVYQFIWDRTRMVRKDFILQNYVGTGGLCDARAVRCHERIARWHCLCEHQLSHIEDYARMQSQQNIQELGQTMKTLNQYYDDSLGRSLVEAPDEQGNESRKDILSFKHGCEFDTVQGKNPVDFDGSILSNDGSSADKAKRLIGTNVDSFHHGTAEPEMRGLYILLTLDNDGGMEVLKYAARLYQKRPEVYNSVPVQLALSVFNAKNDSNYARFFSILRDNKTPYLFACVMFKYVESMRKLAIKICSRSYGGRTRESGESLYDSYPLPRFTRLCCYEDDDETRAALRHYSIAFGEENGQQMIFWRRSSFKEPRDAEKGTIIPLRPRKMIKTIESKLNGATRLAICRGQVSGGGAYHSATSYLLAQKEQSQNALGRLSQEKQKSESPLHDEDVNKMKILAKRLQEEAELRRRESERQVEAEKEKKRLNDEIILQRLEMKQQEEDRIRMEQLQKEQEREHIERERQRALLLEAERQHELHRIEELKKREEDEKLRIQKEEEFILQKRQEEMRLKEAELDRMRREKLEADRIRREEETRRLEDMKRKQEEQALLEKERRMKELYRRRQEELLIVKREVMKRVTAAKRRYFWKRLMSETRSLSLESRTCETLSWLGCPPKNKSTDLMMKSPVEKVSSYLSPRPEQVDSKSIGVIRSLEHALREKYPVNSTVTSFFAESLRSSYEQRLTASDASSSLLQTFLIKVAVIFPDTIPTTNSGRIISLIRTWLDSRFSFATCFASQSESVVVRVIFVDNYSQPCNSSCDAALFVVPWLDKAGLQSFTESLERMGSSVDASIPRACLCVDPYLTAQRDDFMLRCLKGERNHILIASPQWYDDDEPDHSLRKCCGALVNSLVEEPQQMVERVSIAALFFHCVHPLIQEDNFLNSWNEIGKQTCSILVRVIEEIDKVHSNLSRPDISWPAAEFTNSDGEVPDYFGVDDCLPANWISTSSRFYTEPRLMKYASMIEGGLKDIVSNLTCDAPAELSEMCRHLLDRQLYRTCLERALIWRIEYDERSPDPSRVFLPTGLLDDMIRHCIFVEVSNSRALLSNYSPGYSEYDDDIVVRDDNFNEAIDLPQKATPCALTHTSALKSKRTWMNYVSEKSHTENDQRQTPMSPATSARKKRRTMSQHRKELSESMSYTRKLEHLLLGTETVDMLIGTGKTSVPLSLALRGAPSL